VVIVEPYSSGSMLAPAFRHKGFSPCAVTVAGPTAPNASTLRLADFDQHIIYDDSDSDAIFARLREMNPAAIIPGTHTGVILADRLAAALTPELANVPELSQARHHKGGMNEAVAKSGLPVIKSLCSSDPAEIGSWVDSQGLGGRDLVVKPVESAGTDRVTFVGGDQDCRDVVAEMTHSADRYGHRIGEVLIQEHVTGTEYAVDTFSYDGKHAICDIARYGKVSNQRHMALYESMEFLPFDYPGHDQIIHYVKRALDALGFRFGAAHTELMVTDNGPLLIEVNARLAGGNQPWVCQLATGGNPIDHMIRYLLGYRDIRLDYALEMSVMVVFFAVQSAGYVSNISVLEAIRELPSCYYLQVNVQEGDYVPETSDLFDSQRLGILVLGHSDSSQVHADHRQVRRIAAGTGRPRGFVAAAQP
jgi:biotin carboxylase